MPIPSFLANLAVLAAVGLGYLLVLAIVLYGMRSLRARQWRASEIVLSTAVGVAIFVLATTVVDAVGAALRVDLAIGAMSPEQAEQLQLVLRIGLVVLYVSVVVLSSLASRPLVMRLGRVTHLGRAVSLTTALFIVISLPLTDLLHACYLQTTVVLPSRC